MKRLRLRPGDVIDTLSLMGWKRLMVIYLRPDDRYVLLPLGGGDLCTWDRYLLEVECALVLRRPRC